MPAITKKETTQGGKTAQVATPPKPKGKGKAASRQKVADRVVQYPDIEVVKMLGDNALDHETAMAMLGWEEVEEGAKGGYLLTDENKKKIRCTNNDHNRPFTEAWCRSLAQDILNRHWADMRNAKGTVTLKLADDLGGEQEFPSMTVNGETIIIGRTGLVLSAQHRLVALVLASQLWEKQPHWKEKWPDGPPTIEAIVVRGIDESPETTSTLDNVRPRTFGDVLFANSQVFRNLNGRDRAAMTKVADDCIKFLWRRTGCAAEDSFTPYPTHSEKRDFLERHPKIKDACNEVWVLNGANKVNATRGISRLGFAPTKGPAGEERMPPARMNLGTAAGLLYLMGCSDSDGEKYRKHDDISERVEKGLNWDQWAEAKQFWSDLSDGSPEMKPIREAMAELIDPEMGGIGSEPERLAIVCLGWRAYKANGKVTAADVDLSDDYKTDEKGALRFKTNELHRVEGIDLGPKVEKEKPVKVETPDEGEVTEGDEESGADDEAIAEGVLRSNDERAEIEDRKEAERKAKQEQMKNGKGKKGKTSR